MSLFGFVGNLLGTNSGNSGGAGMNYNAATYQTVNPATLDQANQTYGQAQTGLGMYQGLANGTGPNPAQAQLNQATQQNIANQGALMAAQRGSSANPGLIARQAAMQGNMAQQQAAGQAATMNAQQQLAGIQGYNQAAQSEQQNILGSIAQQNNANVGMESNVNTNNAAISGITAKQQAQVAGGITNAFSGKMPSMASGGMVGDRHFASGGYSGPGFASPSMSGMIQQPQGGFSSNAGFNLYNSSNRGAPMANYQSNNTTINDDNAVEKGVGNLTDSGIKAAKAAWAKYNANPDATAPNNAGNDLGGVQSTPGASSDLATAGDVSSTVANAGSDASSAGSDLGGIMSAFAYHGGRVKKHFDDGGDTDSGGGGSNGLGSALGALASIGMMAAMAANKGGSVKKPVNGEMLAAEGKEVPGKAKVKGDSLKNDTVKAFLSPGEVVIPRHVMQSNDPAGNAAKFVAAVMAKNSMRKKA